MITTTLPVSMSDGGMGVGFLTVDFNSRAPSTRHRIITTDDDNSDM
jgi:hypothetical protein